MPEENKEIGNALPLIRWRPLCADGREEPAETAVPSSDALLIGEQAGAGTPTCDLHALARSARNGILRNRLFEANPDYEGEAWYDTLAYVNSIAIGWRESKGVWQGRRPGTEGAKQVRRGGPERIAITIAIEETPGGALSELYLPIDVAVGNPEDEWPENSLLVAAGADPDPLEAAEFLADACHVPREPSFESDSKAHQRAEFIDRHFEALCRLLLPPAEAARRIVEHLAGRHLEAAGRQIPAGSEVTLTLRADRPPKADVHPGAV